MKDVVTFAVTLLVRGACALAQQAGDGALTVVESEETGPVASERAANGPAKGAAEAPGAEERAFHLNLAVNITTSYFSRGALEEDTGLIVQPAVDLGLTLAQWDHDRLEAHLGTWNSVHSQATGADEGDAFNRYWFEQDLSAGLAWSHGAWTFSGTYLAQTSPADVFATVQEFDLGVAYDDSEALGAWAMHPAATVAFEVGPNAVDGRDNGVYLELGVAPGFGVPALGRTLRVSFPVTVGLSLHDFYQNERGDDEALGFVQAGPKVSVPLGSGRLGEWTLSAGISGLYLGSHTAALNDHGRRTAALATVGLQCAY